MGQATAVHACLGYSIHKFTTAGSNFVASGCVQSGEARNAEVPDLVYSLRTLLAPGAGRVGSLSASVAAAVAVPDRGNCRRIGAGAGVGYCGFAGTCDRK